MKWTIISLMAAGALFVGTVNQVSASLLSDWRSNGLGIEVLDKTFYWEADNLPDATSINIDTFFSVFRVVIANTSTLQGGYNLDYRVKITDPNFVFKTASLETNVEPLLPDVQVTKEIFSDKFSTAVGLPLVSLSGNPGGTLNIPGNLTEIWVRDTFSINQGVVSGDGAIFSTSNGFTQTAAVPEPASLAIWGGLVAAGLLLRRRRKA